MKETIDNIEDKNTNLSDKMTDDYFKFSDKEKVRKEFKKYFNEDFLLFFDKELSFAYDRIVIDIVKFDDFLHKKFGNYEEKALSMANIMFDNFGYKATKFFKKLL